MKKLILTLVLSVSPMLYANIGVETFIIQQAQFAPNHLKDFSSGHIVVNYDKETVTLTAEKLFYCPPEVFCAQVMPQPKVVELPIKYLNTDACGITHIIAEKDLRPVDGNLQKIIIDDTSEATCKTLVNIPTRASYVTSYFDRRNNEQVTEESKMVLLKDIAENIAVYQFAEGQFIKGYPSFELPVGGSLKISETHVEMTIQRKVKCPANENCPTYSPMAIHEIMPIVKIEKSFCGNLIVAKEDDGPATDGITRTIEIMDYSSVLCKMRFEHPIVLKYTTEGGIAGLSTEAEFNFDRKIVSRVR